MNSLKIELKRARPALGTILLMRLEAPADASIVDIDETISRAFDLAEELEDRFSKFREASDVSRLNQASVEREVPVSHDFLALAKLALEVWKISGGAFNPFSGAEILPDSEPVVLIEDGTQYFARKTMPLELDLSGIAKGFVVDRVAGFLAKALPSVSGVINAGGDLRFFNTLERQAEIRLSTAAARRIYLNQDSIATSGMNESLDNPLSTTVYHGTPRSGLDATHSVSVVAETCATADALTKIGWFGDEDLVRRCADHFAAQVLVFNQSGEIHQRFGTP